MGTDYSTDKYGLTDSTDVWYVPFSASYETGAFTYKVTVPWIRVTGSGEIVPGGFDGAGDGAGTFDNRKGASKSADSVFCTGLSDASPDVGGGVTLRYYF